VSFYATISIDEDSVKGVFTQYWFYTTL